MNDSGSYSFDFLESLELFSDLNFLVESLVAIGLDVDGHLEFGILWA